MSKEGAKSAMTFAKVPQWRGLLLVLEVLFYVAGAVSARPAPAVSEPPRQKEIRLLGIDGVINPFSSRYLKRELLSAADSQAMAVVLQLNTPGGLESSMREMVQTIMGSKVPVIVYVAPSGARAASAGMFLTIAGHIAAMAPGTNIGAAHPVMIGGERPSDERTKPGQKDQREGGGALTEKVVNDAAALARSIAVERGRNAAWAESAVRKSVSLAANDAKKINVIDFIASDVQDLVRKIDGRQVTLAAGKVTLSTKGARMVERPMNFPERLLMAITDPNIAYILMTVGMIGIIAELYSPGLLFPGITGIISLILAFTAFGSLPVSWAGVALVLLGIGLFVAELQIEGFGIVGIAGIVAFVLGSLVLFRPISLPSPALPAVHVKPWLIVGMASFMFGFLLYAVSAALQARRRPVSTGVQALLGAEGVAVSEVNPRGTVRVGGENWTAELERNGEDASPIHLGDRIQVAKIEGVTLMVRKKAG